MLLISAVLITSCPESLNFSGLTIPKYENPEVPPPAGKSYIRVSIGSDSDLRTIMPTLSVHHYALTIHRTDVTTEPDASMEINGTSTSGTIVATSGGHYSATIVAYSTSGTSNPIASGTTVSDVIVGASGLTSATVTLSLTVSTTTSAQGTFKWNVTLPTTPTPLSTATLTLSTTPGGAGVVAGVAGVTLIGESNNNNTAGAGVAVNAGVYYVTVNVTATDHASYRKMDVVHIYSNMTTTYEDTLPAALAENTYTVTYGNFDGRGNGVTNADPVKQQHGSTIREYYTAGDGFGGLPSLHASVGDEGEALHGYIFDKWYKDSDYTTPWVFASDKIYRPITLYGNWIAPIGISVTITDPVVTGTTFTLGASPSTISQTTLLESSPNVVITVSESTASGWTNFRWYKNGTLISGSTTSTLTLVFNTLGNAGEPPAVGETVSITLIAATDPGNVDYSGTMTLTIGN